MSPLLVRASGAIVMVLGAILLMATMTKADDAWYVPPFCPTGFANFGDSLTDTGNFQDAFPFLDGVPFELDAEHPPYGETFFGAPAKRFSNGRLVPDFFSLAFRFPLLDAYFSVTSFNYAHGINFASSGASAAFSPTALSPFSVTPFQTSQFIRFKNSQASTVTQGFGQACYNFNIDLPPRSGFQPNSLSTWLYTITAGGNDLLLPFEKGQASSVAEVTILIQNAIEAIIIAIITLYKTGARQFLIFGLPASGCSPIVLTYNLIFQGTDSPTDNFGCSIESNEVAQTFNSLLLGEIKVLRTNLSDAHIAFFDYYSANIAILNDTAKFGFNRTLITTACCGAPGVGTFNFNPNITCGHPAEGSNNCTNPDEYVSWDGVHYTDKFYRAIATFALNGNFTDGGVNYTASCNLDFRYFGSNVTLQQAYPPQKYCNNLFT